MNSKKWKIKWVDTCKNLFKLLKILETQQILQKNKEINQVFS
jgi:hypothetical protein